MNLPTKLTMQTFRLWIWILFNVEVKYKLTDFVLDFHIEKDSNLESKCLQS